MNMVTIQGGMQVRCLCITVIVHFFSCWIDILFRDTQATLKRIEDLRLGDSAEAAMAADWLKWCNAPSDANGDALHHALNLHQDPSRGRTHIVFKTVRYIPTATALQDRFSVDGCEVFRIQEILPKLEELMGLDKGEGQEYIDGLFEELDANIHRKSGMVPFIDFTFSMNDKLQPWLASGERKFGIQLTQGE